MANTNETTVTKKQYLDMNIITHNDEKIILNENTNEGGF